MMPDHNRPDMRLSFVLAMVGGYGDAAGFVLARTFTGHVTGNLVLAAIALAGGNWRGLLTAFVATAVFLLGAFLSALAERFLKARSPRGQLPVVLGVEVLLVVAACMFLRFPRLGGVEAFVICMSLALGLQNGAFRRAGGISVHTTYLTGMITGLIATEVESYRLQALPQQPAARDVKIGFLYGIWAAFFAGAGIGAGMILRFKEFGLLGAALLLVVAILHLETSSNTGSDKAKLKTE